MNCLDYGLSFINSVGNGNAPRFWVESRCRIIDNTDGSFSDYYQCGSCKSEDTFAEKSLFINPNYDFLPVFGEAHIAVFRRHADCNDNYVEYRRARDYWGGPVFDVQEASQVGVLDSNAAIFEATQKGLPIVHRLHLALGAERLPQPPKKSQNSGC